MDNKIEVFKNEQFGEVRTILEGETLLFCGSDVARALGYAIPSKAVNTHCKGVSKMEAPSHGGTQTMLFITEGDVYRLIVRSKLPTAEKFEHWLFDEVVPTIRKTGGYMTDSLLERIQNDPAVIFEIADALRSWKLSCQKQSPKQTILMPSSIRMTAPISERRRRNSKSRSASSSSFFSKRNSCSDLPPVSFFRTTSTATMAYSSFVIS